MASEIRLLPTSPDFKNATTEYIKVLSSNRLYPVIIELVNLKIEKHTETERSISPNNGAERSGDQSCALFLQ